MNHFRTDRKYGICHSLSVQRVGNGNLIFVSGRGEDDISREDGGIVPLTKLERPGIING